MKKFKVLKHTEYALVKVGIHSTQNDINSFYHSFAPYSYILFILITYVMSCSVFIYQNKSDFDVVLRTSTVIVGASQAIGMFFSYGIRARKIQALHLKLQEIVENVLEGE